jgi:RNase adaptor protein for sRNA GlmZ degradation
MQTDICDFLDQWLPSLKNDHRSYVTVAIGCTGGQHRSVYAAEQTARHLRNKYKVKTVITHMNETNWVKTLAE